MKLDSVADRYDVIDKLIKKTFKLDALWLHDEENVADWSSNIEIMTNLIAISDMIRTEQIFHDTFNAMSEVRTRNVEEKEVYLDILYEKLTHFIDKILLNLIEFTFDNLDNRKFKTEVGRKFHKDVGKKLDALIKKYQDLYDL